MRKNWSKVKNLAPMDIREETIMGKRIERKLFSIERLRDDERACKVLVESKGELYTLIKHLIILVKPHVSEDEFKDMGQEFGRILKRIDDKEKGTIDQKLTRNNINIFAEEIKTMLYGEIYKPLFNSAQKYPKDSKLFCQEFFSCIKSNVSVFGSDTRQGKSSSMFGTDTKKKIKKKTKK